MSDSNLQFADVLEPQARVKATFAPYARSPLHDFDLPHKAQRPDGSRGVWMNELGLLGYVIVRGDAQDPAFVRGVRSALGTALPTVPGTMAPFAHGVALWQAPDEWLLVCARTARQSCIAALETALHGVHSQVVDNSGGLTTVYLTGREQVTLLRHVGVYDFEALGPGRVASTVCGKATITVLRHDDRGLFLVFRRSFADYVWRLLAKAARPYGLGIAVVEQDKSHPLLRLV